MSLFRIDLSFRYCFLAFELDFHLILLGAGSAGSRLTHGVLTGEYLAKISVADSPADGIVHRVASIRSLSGLALSNWRMINVRVSTHEAYRRFLSINPLPTTKRPRSQLR